jgi:DNA-binding CsgD family transcriptional regulator
MDQVTSHAAVDAAELTALIGDIYDSALSPERCQEILAACREFVGGISAAVFAKDVSGRRGGVYYADGAIDPEQSNRYFSQYAPLDPTNVVQVLTDVERAIVTSDHIDLEEFSKSRLAREWALPQGLVDMVLAPIERQGTWALMFGVFRHERHGRGEAETLERVQLLAPHMRRMLAIGKQLADARGKADRLSDTIDGLAASVFLVDDQGRLVHANASGRNMLETSGALVTGQRESFRLEGTMVRDLLAGTGGIEPGSTSIETPSGETYVAHVLPLGSGKRRGLGHADAAAALFVQPAEFNPPSVPEALARTFDLTPTELRVVLATVRYDGAADIAEALDIGEATVRTHLHRIFAKTGTRRQADIVKLVAGFASPLRKI